MFTVSLLRAAMVVRVLSVKVRSVSQPGRFFGRAYDCRSKFAVEKVSHTLRAKDHAACE